MFFAAFHSAEAGPSVQVKNASKPVLPLKKWSAPPSRISHEYDVFEKAKSVPELSVLSLSQIVETQQRLRNLDWTSSNKTFQKDIEELFWFYEITRAEKASGSVALNAWMRALQSLNQFKWVYAWTETTSKSLLKICKKKNQKKSSGKTKPLSFEEQIRDEKCSWIAKKVNDAFPKAALETQPLKELLSDAASIENPADKFDRLSQPYSEKIEKDEVAFAEVLNFYLNHEDSSLYRKVREFMETFPKSLLRFRASFLMAERLFANNDKKEAEQYYLQIISETPYSYYAIVSSERLGISLTSRISPDPIQTPEGIDQFNLNLTEKEALCKLENLVSRKKFDGVEYELEQFTRIRTYPTSLLIYLTRLANRSGHDLSGFRFATEVLQRKGEAPLNRDFMEMIFPDRFNKEISEQSKLSKIDPILVVSLMKQESGFKKSILSSSGAVGLMQLMPFTAIEVQKDLYLRKLREPSRNITVGTKYISSLLNEKFNGNIVYALAGYNAGPTKVAKWKKDAKPEWGMQEFIEAIPFKETRDYVMSILRNRYWYQYRKGIPVQSVFEAWRSP